MAVLKWENHTMEKFTEYKTTKFQLQHLCYEIKLIYYEQNNESDTERGNMLYCSLQNQCVMITSFVWPLFFMMCQKHENRHENTFCEDAQEKSVITCEDERH